MTQGNVAKDILSSGLLAPLFLGFISLFFALFGYSHAFSEVFVVSEDAIKSPDFVLATEAMGNGFMFDGVCYTCLLDQGIKYEKSLSYTEYELMNSVSYE